MIALYKKRPTLVRWSSGSVAGSVGAKVQHFSEITFILYAECLFEVHFYVFFAVFSVVAAVPPNGSFRLTADPDWDSVNGYTF